MNILLIDDDKIFCETFKDFAEIKHQIRLTYFHNHADGFAELRRNSNYKAIILDARCFRTPEDEKQGGDGEKKALDFALKLYDSFGKETGRYLPFAVYTAYSQDFADFFDLETRKSQIFTKGKDQDRVLDYLKTEIEKMPETQLERQYADVFEVFEKGYLGQNEKNDLLNLLKNMGNAEDAEVRKNLALIRTIKENMIRRLGEKKSNYLQPFLISQFSTYTIPYITNEYGSHNKKASKDIQPTKYAVISLTNALLELLLWFKSEMK